MTDGETIARTQAGYEDHILAEATRILESRLRQDPIALNSPRAVQDFLKIKLGDMPFEVFCILHLDAQHRLIECEQLFRGTLTQTSVYPREVVKQCLKHNAAAVILSHNHPSGICEPSRADELLTQTLKAALDLVDIKVLDHIVCAGNVTWSFAERGRL